MDARRCRQESDHVNCQRCLHVKRFLRPRDQPEPDFTTEEERRLIASSNGTSLEPRISKSHTRVSNILDNLPEIDLDTAAIDLFVLADYEGNQLCFIDILDLASTFGVVAMIPSKHPKIVWDLFFKHWITPFGEPQVDV